MMKKYSQARPRIPRAVVRQTKVEARHGCLVCKAITGLENHHIDENRENNSPENIAPLCPTCHSRFHSGEITRLELLAYKKKANEESEVILELRQEIRRLTGMELVSVSESFAKTRLKYLNSINDFGEKLLFYQAFVFLLPPFYMDERGQAKRAVMRGILSIEEAEESELVSHLNRTGRLKVINGGLMVLVSAEDAKVALEELWTSKTDAMSALIDGFLGI